MRTLVLRSANNQINVNYKVDLLSDEQENFTVMDIGGLDDLEIDFGIQFRELNSDLETFKKFAQDNNLLLDSINTTEGGSTTAIISSVTALDITTTSLPGESVAVAEIVDITQRADSGGDLNNKHFVIYSPENRANLINEFTSYYVWFDVDGTGVDPKPVVPSSRGQAIGVTVAISSGDSNSAVATAVRAALGALSDFSTGGAAAVVTVTMATLGAVLNAVDGNIGGVFGVAVTTPGVDNAYSETVVAVGGNGSLTFSITSGALPAGYTLNTSTGIISGNAQGTGAATFDVTVADQFGATSVESLGITIS